MDASRIAAIAVAALALLALSVAATTLETAPGGSPVDSRDSDPIRGEEGMAYPGQATATEDRTPSDGEPQPVDRPNGSAPGSAPGDGLSPLYVLAALVAIGLVAVVLVVRSAGSDQPSEPAASTQDQSDGPPPSRIGDELATPASNEVYRAWCRFEEQVGERVSPGTTPADVATVAIAAGYPEAAVRDLCTAYCDVRYGGEPVTEERARRAREAIDRIERGGS